MPIPVTSLDDRTFDDLVAEARARLQSHLPELTQVAEGDPLHALTDLFAWMTESVIYRANLIPERQRQAFLNLLQIPLRPAQPARGIVCIDAQPRGGQLPPLLRSETELSAGDVTFTSRGELQPTPLALSVMIKEALDADQLRNLGIPEQALTELYGPDVQAFRPRALLPERDRLDLETSYDKRFYLLLRLADKKLVPHADALRENLAGRILNLGLAPPFDLPAEQAEELSPRKLRWELIWQESAGESRAAYLPLEVVGDTSRGGRQSGVVRLRLPRSTAVLKSRYAGDPKDMGRGNTPPEPPTGVDADRVLFWIAVSAPDDPDFTLGYAGLNAVEVVGQEIVRDQLIGVGDGRSNQRFSVGRTDGDPASLALQVSEQGSYVTWRQVSHFAASDGNDRVYRFDPASGAVTFGDGLRGMRPPAGSRIRVACLACGGGANTNQPAGAIKQIASADSGRLVVRHEWPTRGGLDRETVQQAERRIPQHLGHRNRAVTREDFVHLAEGNPLVPVGRAEAVPGLLPGTGTDSVRTGVPGAVSVFVLPPRPPAMAGAPRPTAGMLRDVYGYLDERKLLGTELYVLSPEFVPVAVGVSIAVLDPTAVTETEQAVNRAVLDYLWALAPGGPAGRGWPMGRDIDPNELRVQAARVDGVLSVRGLRLFYRDPGGGHWQETAALALEDYQLPEVMAVECHHSDEPPPAPRMTDPTRPGGPDEALTPVPVIPDVC